MRRVLFISLLLIVVAPLVAVTALVWTETGSRLLIEFAADQANVEASDISGRLSSRPCIGSVRLTEDSTKVTATDLCIDVDWASSLDRFDAHITSISASDVLVSIAENSTPPPDAKASDLEALDPALFVLPELPVEVRVAQLRIQRLTVNDETLTDIHIDAVVLTDGSWQVEALELEHDLRRFRAALAALDTRSGLRLTASVSLNDNTRQSLDANLSINGTLGALAVSLESRAPYSVYAQGSVDTTQINWPFDLSFTLDDTSLDGFGFTQSVSATGQAVGNVRATTLDLAVGVNDDDGTVNAQVDRMDNQFTGVLAFERFPIRTPSWASRASGTVNVVTDSDLQAIEITFDQLAGLFTKDPLNGDVQLGLDGQAIIVRNAELTAGAGSLTANGHWRSTTDWQARAALDQFSVAFGMAAELSGGVDAQSAGSGQIPSTKGDLALSNFTLEDWSLEHLKIELDTNAPNWLSADGRNLEQAENIIGDIALTLSGQPESSEFALTAKHPAADLTSTGSYTWQSPTQHLTIQTANVRTNKEVVHLDQTIRLVEPVLVTLADGGFSITDVRLDNSSGGTVTVAVSTNSVSTSGRLSMHNWQVDNYPIGEAAGSNETLSATLNAAIDVDDLSALVARGTFGIAQIVFSGLPADIAEVSREPGAFDIVLNSDADVQTATLIGGIDGVVDVDGKLNVDRSQSTLSGTLVAALARSEIVAPFLVPYASSPTGEITAKLGVSGTIEAPIFNGRLDWVDGGIDVDPLGLTTQAINASIIADDGNRLRVTMDATDHEGQSIRAHGAIDDPLAANRNITLSIDTTSAALLNRSDAQAHVTSAITYRSAGVIDGKQTPHTIKGTARIDRAEFEIETLPESAVVASSDVVVVGREAQQSDQPIDIDLQLDVDPKAHIVAFGLDTHIEGELRYRAPARKPVAATGTLNTVGGTFEAYGQTLEIQKGRLIFDGPIDDPLIELLATRTVRANNRDYVVTLDASGYTAKLYTQVTSTPTLPEADALSLLVTGRLLSNAGDSGQVDVAAAALAMGIKGAGFLTDKIAATTGLDEFTVSQGQSGIEVGAGLRVNKNLFLSYTYNALSRIGGVLIDYELTRRLRVRATAGDSQSIELQYVVTD